MLPMKEYEFTYMGNFQLGPCNNQSHLHVTFNDGGYYNPDLSIFVGKDDIFVFEDM